jgi:hypothetical protein
LTDSRSKAQWADLARGADAVGLSRAWVHGCELGDFPGTLGVGGVLDRVGYVWHRCWVACLGRAVPGERTLRGGESKQGPRHMRERGADWRAPHPLPTAPGDSSFSPPEDRSWWSPNALTRDNTNSAAAFGVKLTSRRQGRVDHACDGCRGRQSVRVSCEECEFASPWGALGEAFDPADGLLSAALGVWPDERKARHGSLQPPNRMRHTAMRAPTHGGASPPRWCPHRTGWCPHHRPCNSSPFAHDAAEPHLLASLRSGRGCRRSLLMYPFRPFPGAQAGGPPRGAPAS